MKKTLALNANYSENLLDNNNEEETASTNEKNSSLGDTDNGKFEEMRAAMEQQLGDKLYAHVIKLIDDVVCY